MRNGERICREWNLGKCTAKEADCPRRYRHCCSILTKENGRVCCMNNHRACERRGRTTKEKKGRNREGQGRSRR